MWPEIRPNFRGPHTFSLAATAKSWAWYKLSQVCAQCGQILVAALIGCWNQRKLKALIPRVVVFANDPPSVERRIDFLSFLLSYGLMVGKYVLICAMEIQKIPMVVHIFSGFALSTDPMWVYRGVESLCKLLTANIVPFDYQQTSANKSLSFLKLLSFVSLAGNDFSELGTQAEAHCERNLNRQPWSIRRKIRKNIASLFKEFL